MAEVKKTNSKPKVRVQGPKTKARGKVKRPYKNIARIANAVQCHS